MEDSESSHEDKILYEDESSSSSQSEPEPPVDHMARLKQIRELIEDAEDAPIEAGSIWYLVSAKWLNTWSTWCQRPTSEPCPPMNTKKLVDEDNLHMSEDMIALREGVLERRDYYVLPEAAFALLDQWYGHEGFVLKRQAYEYARGETRIETLLALVQFTYLPEGLKESIQISHANNIKDLKEAVRIFLSHRHPNLKVLERLYFCFTLSDGPGCAQYDLDEEASEDRMLEEVGLLAPDSHLYVDVKPFEEAQSLSGGDGSFDEKALEPGAGLVGLRNLGNTCFMNSALQCLLNCDPLRKFFLSGLYRADVNKSNRLGTGGILVEEFANLWRAVWGAKAYSVIDPLAFKYALGRFEGRFLGYSQQDSQEFLSALLDRVHEDLNRVKEKPYTETPDRNGRSDEAVAAEAWGLHKSRNNSEIVDLFHGQLRSTVTCPTCDHVSITFDPFMFLTLPVPSKRPKSIQVVIISEDVCDAADIQVGKDKRCIGGLKEAVLLRTGLSPDTHSIVLIEVFNGEIYRQFPDDGEALVNIRQPGDQIHAYIIRKDWQYVWMTFSVEGDKEGGRARRIGYPVLLPVAFREDASDDEQLETLRKALMGYAQNPRLESDQLSIHRRKAEKIKDYACFHVFLPEPFLRSFLQDGLEDDSEGIAFHRLFLAHHSRLGSPSSAPRRDEVDLHECLEVYMQEEQLSPSESWYCSRCKEHQEGAGKKLDLWRLPEVLVVHLKRFAYDSYYGHKISTPVTFPISDLSFEGKTQSGDQDSHYELFAISQHFGGLGSGHYTALAKNPIDRHWYSFDDSSVTPLASEEEILRAKQSAYLLFYQRKPAPLI